MSAWFLGNNYYNYNFNPIHFRVDTNTYQL